MKHALLIVDVQNALCVGQWAGYDVTAVVSRINRLAAHARKHGGVIALIQHEECHGPMLFGSEGWRLSPALDVEDDDLRIRKTSCDSFLRTELQDMLRSRGVGHVVICGMQTEFCIDSTVRSALARGFAVTLAADGHTTVANDILNAPQIIAHHNATLRSLGNYGPPISVLDIETILATKALAQQREHEA